MGRLGYRTSREIDEERVALKALRGDFGTIGPADGDDGGLWDLHRYAGRQNILRSEHDLTSGDYDQKQVKLLLKRCNDQYVPMDDDVEKQALAKYKAMGLDPKTADFIGEKLFRLVELRLNVKGTWYEVWLKFDKFKAVFSADIGSWVSW